MRGIGTDILEIERIGSLLHREVFVRRVFTDAERDYFMHAPLPAQTAAGIFCAKEAVAKALGTGFGAQVALRDIAVGHTEAGAPRVTVRGYERLEWSLSISHCRTYATATAILWGQST